jgi:acyl-CoA reductase-like NAD-dependent aldehyde dehydrogenase
VFFLLDFQGAERYLQIFSILPLLFAEEFIEKFIQKAEGLRVGDPLSDTTDIGPLVNANALEKIDSQVKEAVREGAEVLLGRQGIEVISINQQFSGMLTQKCL